MCWTQVGTKANEQSGGMAGRYGMRAVPLGPSCDLVVAGKAGMDGLWSAGMGAPHVEPLLRFAPRKNQKRAINEKGP